MATRNDPTQYTPLSVDDIVNGIAPKAPAQAKGVDVWGQLVPKGNTGLGDLDQQAQKEIFSDIRWLEAKDKIQARLAKHQPPPTIPQWETIRMKIPGWDDMPYVEQKRLYDLYLEDAKSVFLSWNKTQPKAKQMDEFEVDKLFREYNPEPVKPTRTWSELLNDIKLGGQSGLASTAATVGSLIDTLSGTPKEASKYWEDLVAAYDKEKSAVAKDARKKAAFELQKLYSDPEKSTLGKLLSEAGIAISNLSVDQAVSLATQMLPSVFIGIATGGAGSLAGLGAQAAGRMATIAGAITNAALTGGDAAATARDAALAMTESQIKSTPEGLALWNDFNGDIDKVRTELAKDASRSGAILGGILGTGGALLPGSAQRAVQKGMTRAAGGALSGAVGSAATGALIGATEEGLTGIAGRAAAMAEGANVNLLEGAGSDFALGLLGEGLGGAAGHVGGRLMSSAPIEQAVQQNEKTIADAIKTMNTATAPTNSQTAAPTDGVTQSAIDSVKKGMAALENQEQLETLIANANAQLETAAQIPQAEIEEVTTPVTAVQEMVDADQLPVVIPPATETQVSEDVVSPSAPIQQPAVATSVTETIAPTETIAETIAPAETVTETVTQPTETITETVTPTEAITETIVSPAPDPEAAVRLLESARLAEQLSPEQIADIAAGNKPEGVSEEIISIVNTFGFGKKIGNTDSLWTRTAKTSADGRALLDAIIADDTVSPFMRDYATNLLDAYNKAGMPLPSIAFTETLSKGENGTPNTGEYNSDSHQVTLSNSSDVRTALHEYQHGITVAGILSLERAAIRGDAFAKSQLALMQAILDKLKEHGKQFYGVKSIYEMFAELTSPEFVALAQRVPLGDLPQTVTYSSLLSVDGKPYTFSANPVLAANELGLTARSPVVEAIAKAIKVIADLVAPLNTLTEKSILDALTETLETVTEAQLDAIKPLIQTEATIASTESAPATESSVAETVTSTPIEETIPEVKLPTNLSKIVARYNSKPLRFENDLDKAAYMLGQRTKYREEYADFIRDHLGYTDEQIEDYTDRIVQQVKQTPVNNGQRLIESSDKRYKAPPLYAAEKSGALAADLTQGSELDIQLEAEKDQNIPAVRQTFTDLLTATQEGISPDPATVGRNVYRALSSKNTGNVKAALSEVFDILGEKFADSMLPIKRWTDKILDNADRLHREVTDFLGAMYAAPNIREHHIVQAHENGGKKFIQNMAEVVKKTKLSEEEVQQIAGYWTSAKYAPKANKRLIDRAMREVSAAQRQLTNDPTNPELQSDLRRAVRELRTRIDAVTNTDINVKEHAIGLAGGMSNAQAAALQQACEARLGLDNLEAIAEGIYDMNAWRLTLDIETGKTDPGVAASFLGRPDLKDKLTDLRNAARANDTEALNALRKEVAKEVRSDYVPLSGHPDGSMDGEVFGKPKGQNPNQQIDRRMEGRLAIPDDGITASFASMLKSAGYAGWRPFQEATAKLYLAMTPEERVDANFSRTTYDRIDAYPQGSILYRSGNGKTYAFQVDGELFDAIRKTNIEESGTLLQYISKPTQWFSYAATQLNPTFAPINMFRDVWERSDLIRARDLRDVNGNKVNANKIARTMWRYMLNPEVWRATFRFAAGRGSDGSKAARALQALAESGGISTRADYFAGSQAERVRAISAAGSKAKKLTGGAAKVIGVYNRTFDLISPLASYMAMTDANMAKNQASSVTLDLMNFRKTGTVMPLVKAIYSFSQPTITGGVNLLSSLVDRKSGKLNWRSVGRLAGYTIVLMAIQAAARAIGGTDEGGEKMRQLSEWTRSNTIAFPIGDSVVTVPLGFGMPRLANSFAQSILDQAKNEQTLSQAFGNAVRTAVVPAISPIEPVGLDWSKKPAEAFMLTFSPTWLKTITEVSMNVKSTGAPITHPEWEKTDQFRSEQGGTNCPEFYRDAARTIRQLTGVDLAPEQVAHILRGYTLGAPGLLRTQFLENPFREEQGRTTDFVLTRRFVQSQSDQGIRTQFYDYLNDINDIRKKASAGEELSDRERDLVRIGDQWDKVDSAFRSRISKVSKSSATEEVKAKRKAELRKQKEPYMFDFVRRARLVEGKITG